MGSYPPAPPTSSQNEVREGALASEPAVLPPTGGYTVQPRRVRRWPSWASSPATYILVGMNCAVYLAMVAHRVSPTEPTINQLMFWGADNAGAVLIGGEWWRIVTAMFVHVGFLHLALNMWCLWNLALLAEPLMGSAGVIAVYILTGAAGNLLSTGVNWWRIYPDWMKYHDLAVFPVGAGASGAVFGIAGALIVLLKSSRLPVPPFELKKLRKSVIYFAAINLVLGFGISFGASMTQSGLRIDNMAHLGGFTCGLLFAAPMVPRLGSPRQLFNSRLRIALLMVIGLLVLFGFYLSNLAG
ncbi:MAG TPA: rhomboid family intramembrane serine protease [Terracidiphilus sp.]|nr:rhomboid family intramembrane serine protease [Terracidiphilus sp.]